MPSFCKRKGGKRVGLLYSLLSFLKTRMLLVVVALGNGRNATITIIIYTATFVKLRFPSPQLC